MAEISAKTVKDLRDKTGAGMMECKKALEETGGDIEKAIEYLRKRGAAMAAKRADREAKEGLIAVECSADQSAAVMVEVNCETDFVARSEDFTKFAKAVAVLALAECPQSKDELLSKTMNGEFAGQTVATTMESMVGKVGEKIEISRLAVIKTNGGLVTPYVHPGSKLAALVELATDNKPDAVQTLAKDLAMQVAASAPLVKDRSEVPTENIEREREIFRQQALGEGKPEKVIDRIISGKIEKYYQDVVLLEQAFIKDGTKTVSDVLKEISTNSNAKIELKSFTRFQLGER